MRILFVHSYLATFTKVDLEILRSQHEVRELYMRKAQLKYWVSDIFSTLQGVLWADMVFAWFGGYHALVPFLFGRLLGRKCVVVASGYDVANMPEIDYGNMRSGLRKFTGRLVFRLAHKVFAVSNFTKHEAMNNAHVPPHKIQVIYHGVTLASRFDAPNFSSKGQEVVTVAYVSTENLSRKGLENFVRVAQLIPEASFSLIGPIQDNAIEQLKAIAPPNLKFTGRLNEDELFNRMLTGKVYVQSSYHEAFGIAVAEAMLCGCVPVVTDRGALPEVTGGLGFTVPYGDKEAMAAAIRKALLASPAVGENCRKYIQKQFPLDKRSIELLNALKQVAES